MTQAFEYVSEDFYIKTRKIRLIPSIHRSPKIGKPTIYGEYEEVSCPKVRMLHSTNGYNYKTVSLKKCRKCENHRGVEGERVVCLTDRRWSK